MLLRSLLAKIALYLFLHAIIMAIRILSGKSSPATVEDPTPIKVINRIITNTLEQTVMFVGLYAYFIFDRSSKSSARQSIGSARMKLFPLDRGLCWLEWHFRQLICWGT
jgi:hypothetical protein